MFTGIVAGCGEVVGLDPHGPGVELTIRPPSSMTADRNDQVTIGESIAVNGCCLTLVSAQKGRWSFEAGSETLARTTLGRMNVGDAVNLERSLRASDRLGGHFVQGHIDDVGEVDDIERESEWVHMRFRAPRRLTRQMVQKGSVAVDGVSLTLTDVDDKRFSVALIPHTLEVTTLGRREINDAVNIETDVIGKYVEKLLADTQG
ncbi:MAG: riboflavin synthase [Planctomycetota bacterium]|nr:MAG: riboflavin synthase [Planctomycetota bacterium]REJ95007.1 MAG: riboflavin synthase [Planctomycetota bacterium]REK23423.1 MAG: riboflavin synthase [Planctomycetota bacterium]REK38940.1 MAG: riboflavin synthase [Planctomycetota bacterium]